MQEKEIVGAQARVLVTALKKLGFDIKLSSAYDVLSRLCHSKDWNALSARLRAFAPGARRTRFSDELTQLQEVLENAERALDDASGVVDAGEGETHAYERELSLLRNDGLPLVRALLNEERPVFSNAPRLMVLPSSDGDTYNEYALVPAGVDLEKVKEALSVWLAQQRDAEREKNGEDSYTAEEMHIKLEELGCMPFRTMELGPVWD